MVLLQSSTQGSFLAYPVLYNMRRWQEHHLAQCQYNILINNRDNNL